MAINGGNGSITGTSVNSSAGGGSGRTRINTRGGSAAITGTISPADHELRIAGYDLNPD